MDGDGKSQMIEQVKEVVELQIGRRKIGRVSSDVTG